MERFNHQLDSAINVKARVFLLGVFAWVFLRIAWCFCGFLRWLTDLIVKKVQLQGKRVTVFGLNRSGIAAAKLLYSHGAVVTLTDTRSRETLSAEIAALNGVLRAKQSADR